MFSQPCQVTSVKTAAPDRLTLSLTLSVSLNVKPIQWIANLLYHPVLSLFFYLLLLLLLLFFHYLTSQITGFQLVSVMNLGGLLMTFHYSHTIVILVYFIISLDIKSPKMGSSLSRKSALAEKLKRRRANNSSHETSIKQPQNAACTATARSMESDGECRIRLTRNAALTTSAYPHPLPHFLFV